MVASSTVTSNNAIIVSGQTATIPDGDVVSGTLVVGGGTLVTSGGAVDTQLQGTTAGSAKEIVVSGGTERSVTVASGFLDVQSGGELGSANAAQGGNIELDPDAHASAITVGTGSYLTISAADVSTVTLAGGSVDITSAAVPLSTVSNGTVTLRADVSASGLSVGSGSTLYLAGGTASGTVISGSGAQEEILEAPQTGGAAETQFVILSGGQQILFDGANAIEGTISAGGQQRLSSNASVSHMTVLSGGLQSLESGATGSDETIESGGSVFLNGGTLAFSSQTTVEGHLSGSGTISETASASTVTFQAGALANFSGAVVLSNGSVEIANGTETNGIQFDFSGSGNESLILGSLPTSPLQVSGFSTTDRIVLSGITSGATLSIQDGSRVEIESGGSTIETLILDSGVDYTGAQLALTETAGGQAAVLTMGGQTSGYAGNVITAGSVSAHVSSGTGDLVPDGARTIGTSVDNGGRLYINGTAIQDEIQGLEVLSSGGRTLLTVVHATGSETVLAGGQATSTTVDGGTQTLLGGSATNTFVTGEVDSLGENMIAGTQIIRDGGVATHTTLTAASAEAMFPGEPMYSDAYQYVQDGGTAVDTTMTGIHGVWYMHMTLQWANGTMHQIVSSGGTAIRTTANVNAVVDVLSGGTATDTMLDGGTLILEVGAKYTGTLTFLPNTQASPAYDQYATASTVRASMAQLQGITIEGFDTIGSISQAGAYFTYNPPYTSISTINQIDISDLTFAGSANEIDTGHIGADGSLTVTEGGQSTTLHLDGTFGSDFYFQKAADGGTLITYGVPCYCPGTQIATPKGERAIESLAIGDMVLTASGQVRPIRWIGRRSYDGRFAAGNPDIMPVLIKAGALGAGLPRRNLRVSPLHAMALEGHLIPASLLVNGVTITQPTRAQQVDYIHIELDTHDLLLAEGAASETFVDDGSRNMFHNADEFAALYPDAQQTYSDAGLFCLPRLEDGPLLEVISARLSTYAPTVLAHTHVTGFVDVITENRVEGWARRDTDPDQARELVIFADDVEIARVTADRFRADLTENGQFSGQHGFSIITDSRVSPASVRVVDAETGQPLPLAGTPVAHRMAA
ncbi:Hint domain-containing protein [Acetobacter estunensis]|uniref:Hint domain-containing protein n=1 Tax=Acetobacter estunensis TaxID=104097 RepID=UPI001C2D855B|nr:Hint domain-containing protein [Acetobacter estunensis]MBV1836334.1 Hint domain-containing protein [Acetobacter estunensis]